MKDAGSTLKRLLEACTLAQIADRDFRCAERFRKRALRVVADEGTDPGAAPRQFRNDEAGKAAGGADDKNRVGALVHGGGCLSSRRDVTISS